MTKKFVKIFGSYSIDAFVMLKSVTNKNFSSSTCLNFENFVWMSFRYRGIAQLPNPIFITQRTVLVVCVHFMIQSCDDADVAEKFENARSLD